VDGLMERIKSLDEGYYLLMAFYLQQAIDNGKLDAGKPIGAKELIAAGLVRRRQDGVRLLAKGSIKAKVEIEVAGASNAAVAAVEKAGGSVKVSGASKPEA